jgi:hypothetical protein
MSAPEKKIKDIAKRWLTGFKNKKKDLVGMTIQEAFMQVTRKGWESKGAKGRSFTTLYREKM